MATSIAKIPMHLRPYVAEQKTDLYTPIDHAGWRYVMRVSESFLGDVAHEKYIAGLEETGISRDRIPAIAEMDAKLQKFGWHALAVSGFIPPTVFIEFQALGFLPIACDMRKHEHLSYTPAPDIIHEAAGHAPIIADPNYAAYLKQYGEVANRAIFSEKDINVYRAVRKISIVKEDPQSTSEDIAEAESELTQAIKASEYVSEANQLSRMFWWTVEYGLVGELDRPMIYGAGLLSSVSESFHCLSEDVQKVPFTLDCINTSYDITRPQPQLFVAPDFQTLSSALDEFAQTMAYQVGGVEGLSKAKQAGSAVTVELETGIQISGTLKDFSFTDGDTPTFVRFEGPVQLSLEDKVIHGHTGEYHAHGFSSPIGELKNSAHALSELDRSQLEEFGFKDQQTGRLEFMSGVTLEGKLQGHLEHKGQNVLLSFSDCWVRKGDQVLFQPDWGTFDLACGTEVVSVFGGAADRSAYMQYMDYPTDGLNQKSNYQPEEAPLYQLYTQIRDLREMDHPSEQSCKAVFEHLHKDFAKDWLLRLEIYELVRREDWQGEWVETLQKDLDQLKMEFGDLIERGLKVIT